MFFATKKNRAIIITGLLVVFAGFMVMAGWELHLPGLQNVFPGYDSMKFNPALCFVLLGGALLVAQFPPKKYSAAIFTVLALLVTLIGLLSASQDLFHYNSGMDQLFITDKEAIAQKYPFPGRMAANTAACFSLFGLAFLGFTTKNRLVHVFSQYALHVVTAITSVALIGYMYGLSLFYNLHYVSSMAIHTAVLLFLLSLTASLLHPSLGITKLFTGKLVGNKMARRVFILIACLAIIFGSLRIQSQRFQLFTLEVGISILAVTILFASLLVIWHTANWLNKTDVKRYEAEEEIKSMNLYLEKRVEERTGQLSDLFERFREGESKFRAAFEYSAIGMALVSFEGNWLKVNKRVCEMLGYSEDQLLSMTFMEITHPDDLRTSMDVLAKATMTEGAACRIEKRYMHADGAVVWAEVNMAAVSDDSGKLLYLVNQIEDITERKTIENQLKKSEEKYRSLIEHASDAIYVLDFEGHFTDANDAMCKMTGFSKKELLQLNITELIDPEQLKIDPVTHGRREQSVIRERRLVRKDGSMFDVEVNVKTFTDNSVLVIARDITERKRLQAELTETELKFRTLAEKSMVGVYISQNERFIYVNPRFAEIFGYEPHELLNTEESAINIIISDEDRAVVRKNVHDRYNGKVELVNYEVFGKKKDGSQNRIEFYGSSVVIDGKASIIGTMLDVTERSKAEDILKRSEANLKTIMDTTDTAYALMDKNLSVIAFNQMAIKFVTSQYNHVPAKGDSFVDYYPKERFPEFAKHAEKVLKGENISYEINYPQPDGSVLWYYVRLFPITNDKNEIFGLMLALSDITERKNAQEGLQKAYNQIQSQVESIKDMAWKQSHLIRSPLANLKGLAAILKTDVTDAIVLGHIQSELDRMDEILIRLAADASSYESPY